MTQRCPYCRRFCTDRHVCDAMARDWWSWNWADEWETQIAKYRYVSLPSLPGLDDYPAYVVSLLAEQRWRPAGPAVTASRLWDGRQTGMASWSAA